MRLCETGRMIDAMSIPASGMQNYAAQFASNATKVATSGVGISPHNIVGMTEAKIGFKASVATFNTASKM